MKPGLRKTPFAIARRSISKRPIPARRRRRRPRTFARGIRRRRFVVAVVASLLLHIIAALLFIHQRTIPANETVATSERVTFDRKPKPAPPPRPTAPPTPRPVLHAEPIVVPQALPVPAPLARVRARPIPIAHPHAPPKELAKHAPHAPVTVPLPRATLGDARIAQITNDLRADIASDLARRQASLAVAPAPLATPHHYGLDAASFLSGDRRHHGLCDPIKDWQQDGFNYYFVACNVKFSDGTVQRQAVPWPVRFPPSNDPFAGTASGEKPLAMPLPGWHLPPGETVTPELRAYARDHGVTIEGG